MYQRNCRGPFDRETLPSHAYVPSPSSLIPSVCVSPSASILLSLPFSQTACKKGISPGPALHCARHTVGVHPAARVKGGDPLTGVQSVRHTLFLFPTTSTKSPIIPSLSHRHPTIASAVLKQPWGGQQGTSLRIWGVSLLVLSFRSLAK